MESFLIGWSRYFSKMKILDQWRNAPFCSIRWMKVLGTRSFWQMIVLRKDNWPNPVKPLKKICIYCRVIRHDDDNADLLLLGFISFSLVMLEKPIATICIPRSAVETFLPCSSLTTDEDEEPKCEENVLTSSPSLLSLITVIMFDDGCRMQGKMSLMSRGGVQELQVLIFFLAFFHVLSTLLTFTLGAAKVQFFSFFTVFLFYFSTLFFSWVSWLVMTFLDHLIWVLQMKRWEHWEAETRTLEYQFSNGMFIFSFFEMCFIWHKEFTWVCILYDIDPRRFQFIHQTSFGRRHLRYWSQYRLLRLPV